MSSQPSFLCSYKAAKPSVLSSFLLLTLLSTGCQADEVKTEEQATKNVENSVAAETQKTQAKLPMPGSEKIEEPPAEKPEATTPDTTPDKPEITAPVDPQQPTDPQPVAMPPVDPDAALLAQVDERVQKELLPLEKIKLLNAPDKVESFKLNWEAKQNPGAENTIAGFAILQPRGTDLTDKQITDLKPLFFKQSSYLLDVQKRCGFMPELALRYHKGAKKLDVLISLQCEMIAFYDGKKAFKQEKQEDIDPALEALKKILDPQIKEFKSKS